MRQLLNSFRYTTDRLDYFVCTPAMYCSSRSPPWWCRSTHLADLDGERPRSPFLRLNWPHQDLVPQNSTRRSNNWRSSRVPPKHRSRSRWDSSPSSGGSGRFERGVRADHLRPPTPKIETTAQTAPSPAMDEVPWLRSLLTNIFVKCRIGLHSSDQGSHGPDRQH